MENKKRLIDANALMERLKFKRKISKVGLYRGLESAMAQCAKAHTVDAVEVVHGEWEKYTDDKFMGYGADGRIRYRKVYSYKCSKCWNYTAVKHKYCPNCGAKMDGGNEDG
jgi:hypothetical protein